jgi:hypothetical protein
MNEIKESDKLADTLTVKGTFEISAKDVKELDSLLVEIKKKQEQFVTFSLDLTCKWEYRDYKVGDSRVFKVEGIPDDGWGKVVNRIFEIENQVITCLNGDRKEDDVKITPIFSCTAKLHIDLKDKEAQKALEDDKQMVLFKPIDIEEKRYREELDGLIGNIKPDGKNITSVTFQRRENGVAVGDPVALESK